MVIRESLRLGLGVPGRLPRMVPAEGLTLSGVHVLGGTVVSSNALMLHVNPMLLCELEKFVPGRWVSGVGGNWKEVVRWDGPQEIEGLVPIEIGRRDCIGRHLAVAEMRIFIAQLVGRGLRVKRGLGGRIMW